MQHDLQRRRFERHVLSVPLHVTRKLPHNTETLPGLTMEVGQGGFSAMVSDELKIGEAVEAKFELPYLGRIAVEAKVRNKNLFRYGFEFVQLSAELQQQIQKAAESLPVYEGGWY